MKGQTFKYGKDGNETHWIDVPENIADLSDSQLELILDEMITVKDEMDQAVKKLGDEQMKRELAQAEEFMERKKRDLRNKESRLIKKGLLRPKELKK